MSKSASDPGETVAPVMVTTKVQDRWKAEWLTEEAIDPSGRMIRARTLRQIVYAMDAAGVPDDAPIRLTRTDRGDPVTLLLHYLDEREHS